jgi:hypothetical protein
VARKRPHIRVGSGGASGPPLYYHAPLQALAQADGAAADTLPRPPAHVRHTITRPEREPQGRLRDVGARNHSHHARHLLARAPQHAGERRQSDGRRAFLARWCSNWCKEARRSRRASFLCVGFSLVLQGFLKYRRSGSNRHGAFAPPDFESGASTNSATPASP